MIAKVLKRCQKKLDCGTGQHQKFCRTVKLIMQMMCDDSSSQPSGKEKNLTLFCQGGFVNIGLFKFR